MITAAATAILAQQPAPPTDAVGFLTAQLGFLRDHWAAAVLVVATFLAVLLPNLRRPARQGTAESLGGPLSIFGLPSRMLSALHTGDVRMHIAWIVAGTALLVALALALPIDQAAVTSPTGGPQLVPHVDDLADLLPMPAEAHGDDGHVDISAVHPQFALVGAAIVALLLKVLWRDRAFWAALAVAAAGVAGTVWILMASRRAEPDAWLDLMGLVRLDPFAISAEVAALGIGAAGIVAGLAVVGRLGSRRIDFIVTALLSLTGMTLAVAATDFLTLFTSVALMNVCNVILLGMQPRDRAGTEAALKVFLTSLVASSVLLFGVALLYAASGDTQYDGVREGLAGALAGGEPSAVLVRVGAAMLLAGVAWLIGAVPLSLHVSDVASGAPGTSVGLVALGPVVVGLLVLYQLVHGPLTAVAEPLRRAMVMLGVTSAVVGALTSWASPSARRAVGHLTVAVAGGALVALGQFAVKPDSLAALDGAAMALLVSLAALTAMVILTAMLSRVMDIDACEQCHWWLPGRAMTAGVALLVALILLFGAMALVVQSEGLDVSSRAWVTAGAIALVIAAARLAMMFRRLNLGPDDHADNRTRFAAFGLFLLAVIAIMLPLVMPLPAQQGEGFELGVTDHLARAIRATWNR